MIERAFSLTLDNWMAAWTPADVTVSRPKDAPPGSIKVGPWPDLMGWSDGYLMTAGCCEAARHDMPHAWKVARMFIDFHTIVVGDGIDPAAAHQAFLAIDEFRRRIAPDLPGADR